MKIDTNGEKSEKEDYIIRECVRLCSKTYVVFSISPASRVETLYGKLSVRDGAAQWHQCLSTAVAPV